VNIWGYDFMRHALLAAFVVGLVAPGVGVFLVQRRQALMGDGIGHVALTGVALGFLLSTPPVLTAVVVAAVGAVLIEVVRERGRASGDVALALFFYGGIGGGVLLIGLAPRGTNANLLSYLFGSITSVSDSDLRVIVGLALAVVAVLLVAGRELFAVCHDEEFARVAGLPVRTLNYLLAITAAVTITIAMRVVGLLLVSALMVVPVAIAQVFTRGFRQTVVLALAVGVSVAVAGVIVSYYADVAPGACIVVIAVGLFLLASVAGAVRDGVLRRGTAPA
jgi:zinc transport system permease protein